MGNMFLRANSFILDHIFNQTDMAYAPLALKKLLRNIINLKLITIFHVIRNGLCKSCYTTSKIQGILGKVYE